MNCPECGALDQLCQTRFDEFLVLEFTDAGYGAVHHLTVAAYMLQHSSKLTREGWLHERELLREFLVEKKPPAFIRNQNKDLVDSGKRTFKIKPNHVRGKNLDLLATPLPLATKQTNPNKFEFIDNSC
jgi:hypothetical protein